MKNKLIWKEEIDEIIHGFGEEVLNDNVKDFERYLGEKYNCSVGYIKYMDQQSINGNISAEGHLFIGENLNEYLNYKHLKAIETVRRWKKF